MVLSNGQMLVGLDEAGFVHDFYYPYVGLENLTSARNSQHKIGIWVDGQFSWLNDGSWEISINFEDEALISNIEYINSKLNLALNFNDFIDMNSNSFIRHITIHNNADKDRDIRLFMHQMFQISNGGRADTALYVPDGNYLLDYKGRYSLAISGKFKNGKSFDQYAVGNFGIENKAGTFMDAIDGELSNNPVEHGGVDSVIRFSKLFKANEIDTVDYWIITSSSQSDDQRVHEHLMETNIAELRDQVRQSWHNWMYESEVKIPDYYQKNIKQSLLVVKAHIDERGSILASGDSSIFNYGRDYYAYCWPRDAAYALWPLIRLGHFNEARMFFEFARDTMHKDGYLMHKYQPDRAVGSTWHPLIHGKNRELAIQEDETAGVIFMINEYYKQSNDRTFIEHIYRTFVQPAANFLVSFVDKSSGLPHASYDLWEEKFLTSSYTVSVVIGALQAATEIATKIDYPDDGSKWRRLAEKFRDNLDLLYDKEKGYFVKGFLLRDDGSLAYDSTLDISSLYGPFMYSGIDPYDPRIVSTSQKVEQLILNSSPSGGVLRYDNDNYFLTKHQYKGNPWVVSTLWLAQYYLVVDKTARAKELIEWSLNRQSKSGMLSEQYDPENNLPLGVSPLVWSHAELINSLLDLSFKIK